MCQHNGEDSRKNTVTLALGCEHVLVPVCVYIGLIYRVSTSFTFPFPPALHAAVCTINASSQEFI